MVGSARLGNVTVGWEEGVRLINDCEYLFVESVRESEALTLELTVTEAKPQARINVPRSESAIEALRTGSKTIEKDSTCRLFRLIFISNHMVSCSVLNECYGGYPEPPEQFTGNLFRVFTWSHLLEFTKRTTCVSDEYPGVLQHYQIVCLNHIVDVICTAPPRITIDNGAADVVQ